MTFLNPNINSKEDLVSQFFKEEPGRPVSEYGEGTEDRQNDGLA